VPRESARHFCSGSETLSTSRCLPLFSRERTFSTPNHSADQGRYAVSAAGNWRVPICGSICKSGTIYIRRSKNSERRSRKFRRGKSPESEDLLSRINLICPDGQISHSAVQSCLQKYFRSRLTQITSISLAVSSPRGAYRDRHGRGMGCGGRGSVGRVTGWQGGLAKGP
jgi:hypothetical protein